MSNTLTLIVMFALGAFVGAEKALHIASEIIKDKGLRAATIHANNTTI